MANFLPLKNAILYCLERLIVRYDLKPQFLDVGCGVGDVSVFLAKKGWTGTAIDVSDDALARARGHLAEYASVTVEKRDFESVAGSYNTVLLMDVLEHIPDDGAILAKLASTISDGGNAVISVPSNPRFWNWDDDFYGHVRRYTPKGINKKLRDAGLQAEVIWDFTFPVFWMMREVYVRVKKKSDAACHHDGAQDQTRQSGITPLWQKSFWVGLAGKLGLFWNFVYVIQFKYFKQKLRWGHEMIILAKKMENGKNYGN